MRILLFSDFQLPTSCADATRVISFSQMFLDSGHDVILCGVCYTPSDALLGEYKGIKYEMLRPTKDSGLKSYKRVKKLDENIEEYIEKTNSQSKIDIILLSNVYYDHSALFRKIAKKHNIKLIVNHVEWFDKNNILFEGFFKKINFIKNRIALLSIYNKMKNIIGISDLLTDYYSKRGCNATTIPTIVDIKDYEGLTHTENDKVIVAYAGSPGRKDYIVNAIKALDLLSECEREKIEIHIYGASEKGLKYIGLPDGFLEKHKNSLFAHGKIPHTQVKEKIAQADFTVLLRPNARYANAGFPTKVGESMACGTPVIANLTSDLHKYIIDGKTGFVCKDESPEACAAAFSAAIALNSAQKSEMRKNAANMAKSAFDYRAYIPKMETFLNRLK